MTEQSVFKRYHSDKHLSEVLPTRWRQKSAGTDMEQNYITVTLHPFLAAVTLYCTFSSERIGTWQQYVIRITGTGNYLI